MTRCTKSPSSRVAAPLASPCSCPNRIATATPNSASKAKIATLYGGRIAEALIYGEDQVSTGASNDIERATAIARSMVTRWGLSEKLGPLAYGEEEGEVFLGRSVTQHKNVSDETAHNIDTEIRGIIDRNYARAEKILKDNMDILHSMTAALIKYETIDEGQIDDLMARRPVREPADWDGPADDKPQSHHDDFSLGGNDKPAEQH